MCFLYKFLVYNNKDEILYLNQNVYAKLYLNEKIIV